MFCFHPIYQPRPWGGRALENFFQRSLPTGPIGESWEIVDRPKEQSQVANGEHSGKSLHDLLQSMPDWLMGPQWEKNRPFPLLIKWLDCSERLSLQVHPPEELKVNIPVEPKTECWYVAHASKEAGLLLEPPGGIELHQFQKAIVDQNLENFLLRVPTHSDDACFVPSGALHAIDAGNLILEVQQNSDTTYRVYDWGRKGIDGKPRDLHVNEALNCVKTKHLPPEFKPHSADKVRTLVDCPHFRIRRFMLGPGEEGPTFQAGEEPRILSVSHGSIEILANNKQEALFSGTNGLLAYGESVQWRARTHSCVLITDHFINNN